MSATGARIPILAVEDDLTIGDALVHGLAAHGFEVVWVRDATAALSASAARDFALAVLDIALPGMSGHALLERLRRHRPELPVLFLTAYDAAADVVAGLDAGADDYLTKPFSLEVLAARLRALLRRRSSAAPQQLCHGRLSLDVAARSATFDGVPVELGRRAFDLLVLLLERAGRVLSRAQIEAVLYANRADFASNAVEVHVHNLRRKFGPDLIRTIRGVGYTIERPA